MGIIDRFLQQRRNAEQAAILAQNGLTRERFEGRVVMPPKPEYRSPFFSYEMNSPALVQQRLRDLSNLFDPRERAEVRLGPPTNGLIETPTVNIPIFQEPDYRWQTEVELQIPLNLPIDRIPSNFLISGRSSFLSSSAERRTMSLETALRNYVSKNLRMNASPDGDHRILSGGLNDKYHEVASMTGNPRQKSIYYHDMRQTISYFLPKELFHNDSAFGQPAFEAAFKDVMTMTFIYCDYLLRFLKINVPPTTVSINPDEFQITYNLGIPYSSLTETEQRDLAVRQFIDESLGAPPEGAEYDIERRTYGIFKKPRHKSDQILILENGGVVFLPSPDSKPQLKLVK